MKKVKSVNPNFTFFLIDTIYRHIIIFSFTNNNLKDSEYRYLRDNCTTFSTVFSSGNHIALPTQSQYFSNFIFC